MLLSIASQRWIHEGAPVTSTNLFMNNTFFYCISILYSTHKVHLISLLNHCPVPFSKYVDLSLQVEEDWVLCLFWRQFLLISAGSIDITKILLTSTNSEVFRAIQRCSEKKKKKKKKKNGGFGDENKTFRKHLYRDSDFS